LQIKIEKAFVRLGKCCLKSKDIKMSVQSISLQVPKVKKRKWGKKPKPGESLKVCFLFLCSFRKQIYIIPVCDLEYNMCLHKIPQSLYLSFVLLQM
jgi:hypothetical protein